MFVIAAALLATKLSAEGAAKVDKVFQQYDHSNTPGCAVAVVRGDAVVYERGYGMADLEHDVIITPETRFNTGSVAKQFTAAAILQLVDQGKLSLDDDVRKYMPELPDYGTKITIRHLLHHTSGLRDLGDLLVANGYHAEDLTGDRETMFFLTRQKGLNFAPGTDWRYSNTGYALLALIVKRVSGQSFRDFMRESVFLPAGMTSSDIRDDHKRLFRGRAVGYEPAGETFAAAPSNWEAPGATNVMTSIADLASWLIHGQRFIQPLLTRDPLTTGEVPDYAFAQLLGTRGEHRLIEHGGGTSGFRSNVLMLPDDDLSVAVLCNNGSANADGLAHSVADAILGEAALLPAATNVPPHTDGLYVDPATSSTLRLETKDGKTTVNGGTIRMRRDGRLQVGSIRIVELHPASIDVTDFGARPHHYVPAAPAKPVTEALAGRYHSEEAATDWTITVRDGKVYASGDRMAEAELKPLYENGFEVAITWDSFVVDFSRDSFTISNRGVTHLRFVRVR
jgi:CubicO group peptidase (beta-lactamase class C family)